MEYEYINSGIDWLGDIPSHWKIDRIKDKAINVVGGDWGNDPESNSKGEKLVVFRVSDLNGIYFSYDNLTYRKIKKSSVKNRLVSKNSLLIEKSGGGEKQIVGRVGYPKGIAFSAICSNFMAKIEFNKTVNLSFMNYYFNFLYDRNVNFQFVQQTTGIQNLNVVYYLSTKVAFPPLPEQKAIAGYLDQACARIDRIIEIKERQLEKIAVFYKSKVFELLTSGSKKDNRATNIPWIPSVPDNWKIERLKFLTSKINSGVTPKGGATSYVDEGIPLIRSQNVKFNQLDFSEIVHIPEKVHNKMKNSKVINGDVLLNITGASLGRCYFAEDIKEANVNQHVCIIRPLNISTKFLYYTLMSEIGQAQIFSGFKGSGREGLNFEAIKNFIVPLPPFQEQEIIEKKIDKLTLSLEEEKRVISAQIKTLKNYRKSLIHECVTGKKQVYKPKEQQMQQA